jgi:hypothetical protein
VREGAAVNMKILRPTGKLKSRKTIRKMTPMARKLAHLTRSAQSVVTRLKYLTDELQRLEMERAAFERQAQNMMQTWTPPPLRDPALGPELPNGEGVSGEPSAGIVKDRVQHIVLTPEERAGYHEGSDADPRD